MKMTLLTLTAVCFVCFTGCGGDKGSGGGAKTDMTTPEGTIAEAIRLLEAKEYKKALKDLTPPEESSKMKDEDLDKALKMFETEEGKKEMEQMIGDLKAAKDLKPTMSDDGKTATYDIKREGRTKPLKLIKVDGKWYMK